MSGVVLGFLTPAAAARSREETAAEIRDHLTDVTRDDREVSETVLLDTARDASSAIAPLTRMEEAFHPYSSYVILPLFALANAGVPVSASGTAEALSSRVGLGVFLGLVLGAPASGVLFAWLAVRLGPARMPPGLDWAAIGAAAPLKGIGFTIAIFITALAFDDDPKLQDIATVAVLAASLLSALAGLTFLLVRHAARQNTASRRASD